jgi:hypothetical protein
MTDTYACGITMDRPLGDLFKLLGVHSFDSPEEIAKHGYQLQNRVGKAFTADQRYAWKALSDPFYWSIYHNHRSTEALYRAGFFDDGLEKLARDYKAYNPKFATTPFHKLLENYKSVMNAKSSKELVVLVTTGGMAPIHNGHIAMMEAAREIIEQDGKSAVVAGFFAPGHDSYVGQKYGGTAAIPAVHRCAMVELATQDSDWLACDPWAARYMPAEINFTDVISRLKLAMLELPVNAKVVYVFGSDNEGFKEALPDNHVCVPRSNISSKLAREGNHDHLDPAVRDYLLSWDKLDTGDLPYLIRNEENLTIDLWKSLGDSFTAHFPSMEELEKRRIQLQSAIRLGIAQLFKKAGQKNKVHFVSVTEQIEQAKKAVGNRATISLDPFFEGDYRIDSTRVFALSDSQLKPLYRANRASTPLLKDQAKNIPDGEYVLVEDDCVTGGTIASAIAILPKGVKIVDKVILSDFSDYMGTDYYDVVDLRDFIVGSLYGGLSVSSRYSPNSTRVPYALPYVSLRARAKIPADLEMEFSRIIWQANVRFFKDLNITINDCDMDFREFALRQGFSLLTTMEEFCQWHVDILLESAVG